MPKVSVIVPVYNAENFIHRCINSILAQSYTDFELLLINDGSKDSSGTICDEYAQKDSRVRVFHKKNGGVSSARNMGLDNAKGEYIAFVDSDDYVLDNFLSMANGLEVDIFVGSFIYNDEIVSLDENSSNNIAKDVFLAEYLIKTMQIHSVWGKLIKLSSINNYKLRFDETLRTCEDTLFMFSYLYHTKSIILSKEVIYYYNRQNDNGLSFYKSHEWQEESNLIGKLYYIYDVLQHKFQIDFDVVRIYDCKSRVNSFVSGLKHNSLLTIYNQIKQLVSDEKLDILWSDKKILQKGERRILFDFLTRKKMFFLLSLYIKYINPRY